VVEGLLIVIVVGLIGLGGWYVYSTHSVEKTKTVASSNSSGVTFSGRITQIYNECSADGTCSIVVNGKSIITGGGLSANDSDNTYGNLGLNGGNSNLKIGQTVSVRALKTSDGYTLQTCSDCYVK